MLFGHLRQELLAGLVCLELVNVLHQDTFVLEHVTLCPQIQAVVPEETIVIHLLICESTLSDCMFTKLLVTKADLAKSTFTVAVIKSSYTVTEYHRIKLKMKTRAYMCLSIFLASL